MWRSFKGFWLVEVGCGALDASDSGVVDVATCRMRFLLGGHNLEVAADPIAPRGKPVT
jgi:hypothetical protein